MKVKELITRLQELKEDEVEVVFMNEYEATLDPIDTVSYSEEDNVVVMVFKEPEHDDE